MDYKAYALDKRTIYVHELLYIHSNLFKLGA